MYSYNMLMIVSMVHFSLIVSKLQEKSVHVTQASQSFQGVNVIQETKLDVTQASQSFRWEGYGLKLLVPPKSLPSHIDTCTITIKASLSGQYQFPPGTELVSPVFWLKCEPDVEFVVPLSLEIEHCAPFESYIRLNMARAICTQDCLPGSFEILHEGTFTNESKYGVVKLKHFSLFSVLLETLSTLWRREYWYKVFYMTMRRSIKIHFSVTWNDEAHKTVSYCVHIMIALLHDNYSYRLARMNVLNKNLQKDSGSYGRRYTVKLFQNYGSCTFMR